MLVDAKKIGCEDPFIKLLLEAVSSGEMQDSTPVRIAKGVYLCRHWNFERFVKVRDYFKDYNSEKISLERYLGATRFGDNSRYDDYGVCDSPEQVVERLRLNEDPRKLVVALVRIDKDSEPENGGWRWHKWGAYIGDKKPQCEYLYDEPDIHTVYTYHVYEPLEFIE